MLNDYKPLCHRDSSRGRGEEIIMSTFFHTNSYGSLDGLGVTLLREAESLSREKGLPYDGVLQCLEKAFDDVIRRFYGFRELVVHLDKKNGTLRVYRPIFPENSLESPVSTGGLGLQKTNTTTSKDVAEDQEQRENRDFYENQQQKENQNFYEQEGEWQGKRENQDFYEQEREGQDQRESGYSHEFRQENQENYQQEKKVFEEGDNAFQHRTYGEENSGSYQDKEGDLEEGDNTFQHRTYGHQNHVSQHVRDYEDHSGEFSPSPKVEPILEPLPVPPFNRVAVQHLKKALLNHIQDLERAMSYEEFQRRLGQIVSCVVKHIDRGNLFVDIGRTEAMIPRSELIPQEAYNINDRLKAYIFAVKRQEKGPQVFLSRAHPGFLGALMTKEVPEIQEGLLEIKNIARDPGSRAKVAIYSLEGKSLDAVGACVGVRGSRIASVSKELGGEKIDIIPWSEDSVVFVVNALMPAEVSKVIVEKNGRYKVIVPDSQKGIAIGSKGWNVRLAHQLTKINMDIVTESAHQQQRTELRDYLVQLFVQYLDVDELMAHFLVSEGFESIQELAETSVEELEALDGLDGDIALELKTRAQEAMHILQEEDYGTYESLGGEKDLLDLELPSWTLPLLGRHQILSLKDFADLSQDELQDLLGEEKYKKLQENQWADFILKARQNVYGL